MEIWKDIEGLEGVYQISTLGRVRRLAGKNARGRKFSEKIRKASINNTGYEQMSILYRGTVIKALLHRMVATAFLPNPNNFPVVNHLDTNPRNNRVENLEWCTQSHNALHSVHCGGHRNTLGSKNYRATISESRVKQIVGLRSLLYSVADISAATGASYSAVHKILNGYSWNQVTGLPRIRYQNQKKAVFSNH
jgi:hypothetical protein